MDDIELIANLLCENTLIEIYDTDEGKTIKFLGYGYKTDNGYYLFVDYSDSFNCLISSIDGHKIFEFENTMSEFYPQWNTEMSAKEIIKNYLFAYTESGFEVPKIIREKEINSFMSNGVYLMVPEGFPLEKIIC